MDPLALEGLRRYVAVEEAARVSDLRLRVGKLRKKITASMSTGDVIHDFVHSGAKQFKGKSKKDRIRMALGAAAGR